MTELTLLVKWRGGLTGAPFAWYAAAYVLIVALTHLPIVTAVARLEWRYNPFIHRRAP